MNKLKKEESSEGSPPLAAFIDNDNIKKGIDDQYDSYTGYDIEKTFEILKEEGELRIGKVYFNPGDFQEKGNLLHRFNMNLFEPIFTNTYRYKGDDKSLADPNMIWDVSKVYNNRPEIKKFAIVSGDKDFLPIMRKLHSRGKDGVLIYVSKSAADDLVETAEKIGWETIEAPPYKMTSSR